MSNKIKIINVVSGKGGTGKTIFSAILADLLGNSGKSVLVIDLDIFVRGLTALLYFHKGQSVQLIDDNELSVADYFTKKEKLSNTGLSNKKLGIHRYRSFDICPSVSRIDEIISFNDIMPNTRQEATSILNILLNMVPDKYDYIILDSRAGYDELISATHIVSDLSICIQEEDDISNVTADNLMRQLERDDKEGKGYLFRVENKVRDVTTLEEFEKRLGKGVNYIGYIPFDMDVMKNFGKKYFWDAISKSLYRIAVTRLWNNLSSKLNLMDKIEEIRISPLGSERLERVIGLLGLKERVFFVYGLLLGILGFGYVVLKDSSLFISLIEDKTKLIALLVGVVGFALALFSLLMVQPRSKK